MRATIDCITVWQPWSSLILAGAKPFEWRGWVFPERRIGTRIGIHAGARPVRKKEIRRLLIDLEAHGEAGTSIDPAIALPLLAKWHDKPDELPLSSVLCTAILGKPIRAGKYAAARGIDSDRIDHEKWGWPLIEIEAVEPMCPARGAQGFWPWTPPQ